MSIRVIEKEDIKCDTCGKVVAYMEATRELIEMSRDEMGFTNINCPECQDREMNTPTTTAPSQPAESLKE